MLTLRRLFLEKDGFKVNPPVRTKGRPRVVIAEADGKYSVTFRLPRLIDGQTFLGIYPAAATLPRADGLRVGDYALLASGEVVQVN